MVIKTIFQQLTAIILGVTPSPQRAIVRGRTSTRTLTNVSGQLPVHGRLPVRRSQTVLSPVKLSPQSKNLPQTIPPTVIDMGYQHPMRQAASLSHYLRIGSQYHPLCRHSFVEQVVQGHHAYSRQIEFRTCALAAAYAGAYGPDSIKESGFSYSMATWRLGNLMGQNLSDTKVTGPTGRTNNNVIDEMVQLVDENLWTREGVADWLESIGY